jgi:phosphatidylinositol 4-kinase B
VGAFYEFVERSRTVHEIKASSEGASLLPYFHDLFDQKSMEEVLTRFAESYSGFCLIQYLLNLKDRNNANIMVRDDGTIFHIDLAFIFESGPGGINFESAPFKMTKEFVKVLGGFESDYFRKFEALLVQHFTKVFECKDEFLWKINILSRRDKEIRCFSGFNFNDFCKKIPHKLEKVGLFPFR